MDELDRLPAKKHTVGFVDSLKAFAFGALAILVSVISACGSGYAVFAAVKSVRWQRAENLATLALFFVGVPTLMLQVIVFLPLAYVYVRWLKLGVGNPGARLVLYLAVLMPAVTLTAIAAGFALTGLR